MERAVDPDIFQWCRDNDSVLLTADKKLTKFLASEHATARRSSSSVTTCSTSRAW